MIFIGSLYEFSNLDLHFSMLISNNKTSHKVNECIILFTRKSSCVTRWLPSTVTSSSTVIPCQPGDKARNTGHKPVLQTLGCIAWDTLQHWGYIREHIWQQGEQSKDKQSSVKQSSQEVVIY